MGDSPAGRGSLGCPKAGAVMRAGHLQSGRCSVRPDGGRCRWVGPGSDRGIRRVRLREGATGCKSAFTRIPGSLSQGPGPCRTKPIPSHSAYSMRGHGGHSAAGTFATLSLVDLELRMSVGRPKHRPGVPGSSRRGRADPAQVLSMASHWEGRSTSSSEIGTCPDSVGPVSRSGMWGVVWTVGRVREVVSIGGIDRGFGASRWSGRRHGFRVIVGLPRGS